MAGGNYSKPVAGFWLMVILLSVVIHSITTDESAYLFPLLVFSAIIVSFMLVFQISLDRIILGPRIMGDDLSFTPRFSPFFYYLIEKDNLNNKIKEWANTGCEGDCIVGHTYILFQKKSDIIMYKLAFIE